MSLCTTRCSPSPQNSIFPIFQLHTEPALPMEQGMSLVCEGCCPVPLLVQMPLTRS